MTKQSRFQGFTLVEILVVVGILSILALILVPNLVGALEDAKFSATDSYLKALKVAIERYKEEVGDYPPSSLPGAPYTGGSDLLRTALEKGLGTDIDWKGPYYSFEAERVGLLPGGSPNYNVPDAALPFTPTAGVILDHFDYPIFYINYRDYEEAGARENFLDPPGVGNETSYAGARGFQLIAVMKDGTTDPAQMGRYDRFDNLDNDGDTLTDEEDTLRSTRNNTPPEDDVFISGK